VVALKTSSMLKFSLMNRPRRLRESTYSASSSISSQRPIPAKNSKDSSVGNAEDDLLRIRSWCRELVPGAGWGGTFATCVVKCWSGSRTSIPVTRPKLRAGQLGKIQIVTLPSEVVRLVDQS
jgi:hypothetical protein